MVAIHTGYAANIAGGIAIGAVTGLAVTSTGAMWFFGEPVLLWFIVPSAVGATIGGICGVLWVYSNRRKARTGAREDSKTK